MGMISLEPIYFMEEVSCLAFNGVVALNEASIELKMLSLLVVFQLVGNKLRIVSYWQMIVLFSFADNVSLKEVLFKVQLSEHSFDQCWALLEVNAYRQRSYSFA